MHMRCIHPVCAIQAEGVQPGGGHFHNKVIGMLVVFFRV